MIHGTLLLVATGLCWVLIAVVISTGRAAAARPRLHPGRRRAADRRRGGRRAPVPEKRLDPPPAPVGRIRRRSRQLSDDQAYECRDGARSQRCGLGNHPERARLSVHDGNAVLRRRPDRQPPGRAGADPGGDRALQLLEGEKTGNFGQLAPSDARRFFFAGISQCCANLPSYLGAGDMPSTRRALLVQLGVLASFGVNAGLTRSRWRARGTLLPLVTLGCVNIVSLFFLFTADSISSRPSAAARSATRSPWAPALQDS